MDVAQELEDLHRELSLARARGVFGSPGNGLCEWCEMPIPAQRLAAIAHARLCVGCQEELEQGADLQERGE
jgi:phage/conjugal plasmid C-4 type zinc finger TraR family protein